jgi:hypothetical protein
MKKERSPSFEHKWAQKRRSKTEEADRLAGQPQRISGAIAQLSAPAAFPGCGKAARSVSFAEAISTLVRIAAA